MAKTRINRKELRRLKQRQAFSVATEVKLLVEQLPNQQAFDAFLLQQGDVDKRKAMFEFCRPFCKFPNPQFPSPLNVQSRIIRP